MKITDTLTLNSRTNQPVELTTMGFGGAPLGNLYHKVEEDDAIATLLKAFELGIRYFDTAPQYGLGLSEQRFGKAISIFGRENIRLSTKIGRILEDCEPDQVTPEAFVDVPQKRIRFDYTYDGVMRSYEDSRSRLGIKNADILLVHDVDVFSQGSQEKSDTKVRELFDGGGYRALVELKDAGDILAIGAGVNEWQVCEKLLSLGDFDGFLLAGRYTLLEQEALDSFLPLCVSRDVGIILGGVFNSGILATGPIEDAKYNYQIAPTDVIERVRKIEEICKSHQVQLKEAAIQFVLGHPAVKTVIPGVVSESQILENTKIIESKIPQSLWLDLKTAGLIRTDAPTPEDN